MIPHSYQDQQDGIRKGDFSLIDIVQSYLEKIRNVSDLNIYVEVFEDEALKRARELIQITEAERGPLWGMVISIKDVLCLQNHVVTAASKMLSGFESQFTATAVQRMLDAGAIIIGRTNCDEFAMGSTNENSAYGPTLNGLDPDRVPGGSSGGAAVSVQMDTCQVALGSDTGGSVRQPAAYCGVIGMKPTYGRISRYGLIAYASSFDQIGILSKDISNVGRVLTVISGYDPMDATCAKDVDPIAVDKIPVPSSDSDVNNSEQLKIATLNQVFNDAGLNPAVLKSCNTAKRILENQGHIVSGIEFDLLPYLVPAYYVLTTAEASSNLSRYDGIRYGHRASDIHDIHDLYIRSRSEGFGLEVKRRIMMGTFVLSVGYYDAYFTKAQQVRRLIVDRMTEVFQDYDIILLPTTTSVAPRLGELSKDPLEMYLSDVFTVLANICGLPAISVPCGHGTSEMPLGIQLIGRKWEEDRLLNLSQAFIQ